MASVSDRQGWERFFEELSAFLRLAERQEGTANESFADYDVQRFERCILNVSAQIEHLRAPTNDQETSTIPFG